VRSLYNLTFIKYFIFNIHETLARTLISETMRLYPPGINAERVCTQNFLIPGTNYTIKKGEVVIIPIFAFHRDPEIFEDPLKFDPGRWDKDRKASTLRGYMTFGHGPRNCIGTSFLKIA